MVGKEDDATMKVFQHIDSIPVVVTIIGFLFVFLTQFLKCTVKSSGI
jgi:hypothetical protein